MKTPRLSTETAYFATAEVYVTRLLDRREFRKHCDRHKTCKAIMDLNENMAETVAHEMPTQAEIAANRWLPDSELAVYAGEYERNSFAGGLQWYRRGTTGLDTSELQLFSGRTIDVPSMFVAGSSDWGTYQRPGVFERMQGTSCTNMVGCHLIDGAGHWVQQEQSERVSQLLVEFLQG